VLPVRGAVGSASGLVGRVGESQPTTSPHPLSHCHRR
jgi:hypothetical protein